LGTNEGHVHQADNIGQIMVVGQMGRIVQVGFDVRGMLVKAFGDHPSQGWWQGGLRN
jgi:hypothetical protein